MRIGSWYLDPQQRTLFKDSVTRSLTPRSWQVLLHLLDNRGELVRTSTLLHNYWRTPGDETYVRKSVSEIRKALDDDPRSPRFIRTIPKEGYVLVSDAVSDPPTPAEATIAVLPFASIGNEPQNEHFADGLTEEILNKLTNVMNTPVVARTSSFQFKGVNKDVRQIARELNASHLLEGSVRRADASMRITAQLIDARSGAHLFSETYEPELGQTFIIQDNVANTIALAVRDVLGPSRPLKTLFLSKRFNDPGEFRQVVETLSKGVDPEK